MSWTVGSHRVDIEPARSFEPARLMIDHRDVLLLTPDMRVRLGEVKARVRLAYEHGVIRPELWIGDQRVPASPDGTERREAPSDASCEVHTRARAPYRSSDLAPPATYECAGCRRAICAGCTAIDRVHCSVCFEAALRIEEWLRDAYRRRRKMRAGVALLGAGALVLFATLSWRLWAASSLGGLIFAGGAALVASALIGRARKPARVWASEPVLRTLHARALGLVVEDG